MSASLTKWVTNFGPIISNFTSKPQLLKDCVVTFSWFEGKDEYYLEYVPSGGPDNQGYIQREKDRNFGSTSTNFKLGYADNSDNLQHPGYVIMPVIKPDVHLRMKQDQGWQITTFGGAAAWDRSNYQINVSDPLKVTGSTGLKYTFMQVTINHFHDKIDYKLVVGGNNLGAGDKGTGDPSKFIMRFVTVNNDVWDLLLTDAAAKAYCCSPLSDISLYTGLKEACGRAGATQDSDTCKNSMGQTCAAKGFDDSGCQTWCVDNPTLCRPYLEKWCQDKKNSGKGVCACFDTAGWTKYSDKLSPTCQANAVCNLSGNLTGFQAACYYPPCLASGMANVALNDVPCPNNVVDYNQCLIKVAAEGGGTISGGVAAQCIQSAGANVSTDTKSVPITAWPNGAIPKLNLDDMGTGGGTAGPPPSIDPNQPPPPDEPPPPPLPDDKSFIQKWWWVFLVAGIGVLIILGLVLWLVMSSGKKPPRFSPDMRQHFD